jgi:hypothetical protein
VYVGDAAHPYSVYDYTPSRKRDGPAEFLKNYRGYLQADAFGGYDGIYAGSRGAIVEVACWAHARRKFHEAQRTAGRVAHEALARIGQLYALEREFKGANDDQRQAARGQRAAPLLESFRQWLDNEAARALPKSPIGQAVSYTRANWQALCRYTEQGYLAIDNNTSERTLRPAAIGRKNWLFVGNDQGGRTAAVLFTMIASAKANAADPFAYLRDVFKRLPILLAANNSDAAEFDELLPNRWSDAHPDARFTHNRSNRCA